MAQRREAADSIGREAFEFTGALYETTAARVVSKCYRENRAAVAARRGAVRAALFGRLGWASDE